MDNSNGEVSILVLDECEAETYWMPEPSQGYATILLSPLTSACNAFSVGTHLVPVGGELPERCFARGDFTLYVDQGDAVVMLDGIAETVTQGDTIVIARQTIHSVTNTGELALRLVWFCIPSGYERLIRESGEKKIDESRPVSSGATGKAAGRDYYQGVAEIGSFTPAKGQSVVVREADRVSYWQCMPAQGYADMIISPHNYASNSFAVGAQRLFPGAAIPPHAHSRNEELLFVTDGHGYVVTDTGKKPIKKGNAVFAGRFAKHGFVAADDNPLEVVWIFSPPELETVLTAMGRRRTPGEEPPDPFMPPANILDILNNGGFAAM